MEESDPKSAGPEFFPGADKLNMIVLSTRRYPTCRCGIRYIASKYSVAYEFSPYKLKYVRDFCVSKNSLKMKSLACHN